MSLSLESMRRLVRKGLGGLDETDLDDNEVDELLNMALWALEDKYPFRARQRTAITELVPGQWVYDLSSITRLDFIESVSFVTVPTNPLVKRSKLARMTRSWYDANFEESNSAGPTRYMREGDCLYVYPVPNEALDIEIVYRESVASLAEGTTEATGLPRSWDEIVVQGAIWRGHYLSEDYARAKEAANFQIGLIRGSVAVETKEEGDSRYARLNVLTDWPVDLED